MEVVDSWDTAVRFSPGGARLVYREELHCKLINRQLQRRVLWFCLEPYEVGTGNNPWFVSGEFRFYLNEQKIGIWPINQSNEAFFFGAEVAVPALTPIASGCTMPNLRIKSSAAEVVPKYKFSAELPPHEFFIESDKVALYVDFLDPFGFGSTFWRIGFRCLSTQS